MLQRKREAERLRYQRIKNDPQKNEEMKEKERLKYHKKKEKGTRKLVKYMNPREHRAAKKKWKKHCAKYRSKKKAMAEITNMFVRENTPNSEIEATDEPQRPRQSPIINAIAEKRRRRAKKLQAETMKKKDKKIEDLRKKLAKYKKRLLRMAKTKENNIIETPFTKLQKMSDTAEGRQDLVKKAFFGEVLKEQLKDNYSTLKTRIDKNIFTKAISGSKVEKYKLWRNSSGMLSYKRVKKAKLNPSLVALKQTRKDKISKECITSVQYFYEDDANSRLGAGKKEFVTRKGVRKQKRYLLDSMLGLYKKFIINSDFKISYQTFCRLRPFWVVKPRVDDRDTCLCITHANVNLKLSALHGAKIIPYSSHQKLLEDLCCDRYNEQCLSRQCQRCVNKTPAYKEFDNSKPIHFKKWVAEKQQFTDPKTKKTRQVTKYLKKVFTLPPLHLIGELHKDLESFLCHERNIVHQFNAINILKKNLSDEDALIHMDFSENYATKCGQEIQAFHFGGSRVQISLHTVVVYLKNSIKSYCTASSNISHSPAAIWTHLQPVFNALPLQIKNLHFLSDGPVTQYRNKTMFYILASKLPERLPNIQKFSWNYSESGHGKGAPDGVGATCKRTADSVVAAGGDVDNLETFMTAIQEKCPGIILGTIDHEAIQTMSAEIEREASQAKTFSGTLRVHQVTGNIFNPVGLRVARPVTLTMRNLSCFCNAVKCKHFKIGCLKYREHPQLKYCQKKPKLKVEDIYDSDENESGPSSVPFNEQYTIGQYVLVKFPVKKIEYRYVGVIDSIDTEEHELTITFLKLCDNKGQMFRVDHNDVSEVSFDQIVYKLPNPSLLIKRHSEFLKFKLPIDVYEK